MLGDMYVTVGVDVPRKLTAQQKDMLRAFDQSVSGQETTEVI